MRGLIPITCSALLVAAGPALSEPSHGGSASTSIGMAADGRLEGGVPFPAAAPGVRLNPRRLNPGGHFATVETVRAIVRAAAVVQRELPSPPGCELTVNDLGFEAGGPIPHHGSHQAGRDVDVLFYLLDVKGMPRPAKGVPLDTHGRGTDFDDLADPRDDVPVKLDAARTWRFLQALAEDEESLIQRVFVAEHIRTLLLAQARRAKAPAAARKLVEDLTCQPGTPHDDHLHLRFFCADDDIGAGCQDMPPIFPWRREQLAARGLEPAMGRPRPERPRSKTSTDAEALAKAGPMHWKVTAFLKLRETWSKQPHPGRVYCR
jgi:penicillin-insensitive murein endopeptidase